MRDGTAEPVSRDQILRRERRYIMVTTLYSIQQGSKSRQNPCQVQPTENIGNLSASARCLWVRTTVSSVVWSAASFSESGYNREDCLTCCPFNKVIKSVTKRFLALGGLHENKLCDNLQAMVPTNVKTVHQTFVHHTESSVDRLGLLSPTHGQRSQQRSGQITFHFDQ